MADPSNDADKQEIYAEFHKNINMTASELSKWLETDHAKSVGIKQGTTADKKTGPGGGESTGHDAGKQIVDILHTKKAELQDEHYAHMRKVNGYIKRHMAQKPSKDIEDSRWRYSLMNWGHDPLK